MNVQGSQAHHSHIKIFYFVQFYTFWMRIFIAQQESPPAWTQEAYRPPRGHRNFLLFRGGGVPRQNFFFFQSEHVSSQIWCQKIFPLLGGGSLNKKFFFPVWTCIKPKYGVKKISLYWGGGSLDKKFFSPFWTCIKPNLVSKIFPLYWDQDPPTPPSKARSGSPPPLPPPSKAGSGTPPSPTLPPPPSKAGSGTPPRPRLDQVPPLPPIQGWIRYPPLPQGVDWHTKWKYNLPSSFGWGR